MDAFVEAIKLYCSKFGAPTALAVAGFSLCYYLSALAARRFTDVRTSEVTGLKVVATLHALIVAPVAGLMLFVEPGTVENTQAALWMTGDKEMVKNILLTRSPTAELLVPITVAFFLFEVGMYSKWKDGGVLMLIHHFGSIALFPVALAKQLGHWHLLLFIAYEISSPFLHVRWFLSRFGSDWKQAFGINNVIFGLAFLGIRNATAPALLNTVYRGQDFTDIDPFVSVLLAAAVIPVILNTLWGMQVLNAVTGKSRRKKKPKAE